MANTSTIKAIGSAFAPSRLTRHYALSPTVENRCDDLRIIERAPLPFRRHHSDGLSIVRVFKEQAVASYAGALLHGL
ncbi:MAG: hypothetical protein J2P21_28215, partial [Chloracidobacterium sp.]|nr:hypothetical protein [Chloracidobacterium sp.]